MIRYGLVCVLVILATGCSLDGASQIVLERASAPLQRAEIEISYQGAIESMAFDRARELASSNAQRQVAEAAHAASLGEWSRVERLVGNLRTYTGDIWVRALELQLLALQAQSKWGSIVEHLEQNPGLIPESREEALVMGRAFHSGQKETVILPSSPVSLALHPILTGQPEIELFVNGEPYRFLLDTGAGMTVLTDEVAEAAGVTPIGDAVGYARTSTSRRVVFRPGVLDKLEIGTFEVANHPVVIVDSADLSFGVAGVNVIQIRGIIGWPLLSKLAVTIDYGRKQVTFARSTAERGEPTSLWWMGYPMVRLLSEGGVPLNFGLDTGAQKTSLKPRAISRLGLRSETEETVAQGAGGSEQVTVETVRDLNVFAGGYKLSFEKIKTGGGVRSALIVKPDGKLGINLAIHGAVTIDYPAGRFTFSAGPS